MLCENGVKKCQSSGCLCVERGMGGVDEVTKVISLI